MLSFRCSLVTSDRYARYILEKKKKRRKKKGKKNGERKIYTKRTLKITCVSWATLASYVLITRERVSLLIAGGTNRQTNVYFIVGGHRTRATGTSSGYPAWPEAESPSFLSSSFLHCWRNRAFPRWAETRCAAVTIEYSPEINIDLE